MPVAVLAIALALLVPGVAAAATYKSGPVTYKSQSTRASANSPAFTGASCGGGRRITAPGVSAGAATISSLAMLDADSDGSTDDGSLAVVQNTSSSPASLTAWAICLSGSKATKLSYAHADQSIASGAYGVNGGASCSSGQTTGLGFRISGAAAETQLNTLGFGFDGHKPQQSSSNYGFQKQEGAKLYSVQNSCISTSAATLLLKYSTGVAFPSETKTFRAACPKGTSVIGGGLQGYAARLGASAPYDSGDRGKAPDNGWKITVSGTGFGGFVAEAICLRK